MKNASRRRDQSEFVRRGLAAIARSEADGDWIASEVVIAKLEAKVAAARERRKAANPPKNPDDLQSQ